MATHQNQSVGQVNKALQRMLFRWSR